MVTLSVLVYFLYDPCCFILFLFGLADGSVVPALSRTFKTSSFAATIAVNGISHDSRPLGDDNGST